MRDLDARDATDLVLDADDVVRFVAVDVHRQRAYLSSELIAKELGVSQDTARKAKKLVLRDHRDELPEAVTANAWGVVANE